MPANRTFACHESVTYTTHADYTFLDNLKPLIERWQGPISLALYAPGTDFTPTLASIRYLRKCGSPLIAEYVTFHVYFEAKHLPKSIPRPEKIFDDDNVNCAASPPWINVTTNSLYRSHKKLLYPVNVGRNIARDTALTYYILASDIELYPSPGIIADFLEMVRRQDPPLLHDKPKVFPLCLFEVESYAVPPTTKEELVSTILEISLVNGYLTTSGFSYKIFTSSNPFSVGLFDGHEIAPLRNRYGCRDCQQLHCCTAS